ncbi:hypothetical protein FACS189443_3720 [Planctomycetales bacterium]|nr:hypothetical protein FACS189443_3720 [Planctomycetales bacterium]
MVDGYSVIINIGGTVNGSIYGGYMSEGAVSRDRFTDNTLNLAANNTSINYVQNFETINFTSAGSTGITTLDTTVRGGTTGSLVK